MEFAFEPAFEVDFEPALEREERLEGVLPPPRALRRRSDIANGAKWKGIDGQVVNW